MPYLVFFFFFIIVPHFVSYEIDLFVCLVFSTVIHHSRDTEGAVLQLKTATSIIILSLVSFCGAIYDK